MKRRAFVRVILGALSATALGASSAMVTGAPDVSASTALPVVSRPHARQIRAWGRTPSALPATDGEPDVARATFDSGLRAVVRERPDGEVAALTVAVRGGSRDEDADTLGAAHFMEHMFFQGTPRRPASIAIDRDLEARGGRANAWTGWESINFRVVVPAGSIDLAIDVLADMLTGSLFDEAKLEKERLVVLDELERRRAAPATRAYDLLLPAVLGDHPARNLPIGNRNTIDRTTRDVVLAFRDLHFVAPNMVVAVAGAVDGEQILSSVADAFAALSGGPPPAFEPAQPPPARDVLVEAPAPGRQARIIVGGPAPGQHDPDRYAMVLAIALLGGAGRRLETTLVDEWGLVASVAPAYLELTDVGVWSVAAGLSAANVDGALDAIRAELRRVSDAPPTPEALGEAMAYVAGSTLLRGERSIDLAEALSNGGALSTYEPTDRFLARIDAVTPDDVQRVARAYLDPDRLARVVLRP